MAGCGSDTDLPVSDERTRSAPATNTDGIDTSAATRTSGSATTRPVPIPTTEEMMEAPRNTNVPETVIASEIVQTAIADLRGRLTDVDIDAEIEVVSVEEVDWPDGSIGCPQPGMVYTQAIVNGTKIVLRHADTEYSYHQGGRRSVFYCPPDRGRAAPPPHGHLDV
jgi:hypothetical protein